MSRAVIIRDYGPSKVLQVKNITLRKPNENEVVIKHTFIGINYYDIRQRKGLIKNLKLPLIIGCEAVGTVEEIHHSETNFKIGDKVAYINAPSGAYCERRIISTRYLIPIVSGLNIEDEILAAFLHKIMVAHMLVFRSFYVTKDMTVLVYDPLGSIARFIVQLCSIVGCKIIGAVKSEESSDLAKQFGCDLVVSYDDPEVHNKILKFSGNKGVSVVYDSLGNHKLSLKSLALFGRYIVYQQDCEFDVKISNTALSSRSISFSAPSLFHYHGDQILGMIDIQEVLNVLKNKQLRCKIDNRYSLDDVAKAHDSIEGRRFGSGVIVI